MAVNEGANVDVVDAIAGNLAQDAKTLDGISQSAQVAIDKLVGAWRGADGTTYVQQWHSSGRSALTACSTQLETMAKSLHDQMNEQRVTSGDAPTAFPGGLPGGGGGNGTPGSGNGSPGTGGGGGNGGGGGGAWGPPGGPDAGKREDWSPGSTHDGRAKDTWVLGTDNRWHKIPWNKDLQDPTNRSQVRVDGVVDPNSPDGYKQTSVTYKSNTEHEFDTKLGKWVSDDNRPWNSDAYGKVKDHTDVSVQDSATWLDKSAHGDVALASGQHTFGDPNGTHATVGGSLLSAEADAGVKSGFNLKDGAYLSAAASAGAYLATANANFQAGPLSGDGRAFVGAEASGEGKVNIGPDGAHGSLGAEAFAGGKAQGEIRMGGEEGSVGVGGEVSYGIGAHANVSGDLSLSKVSVNVDVGATLGLGGGVKFKVDVNPKKIISDIGGWFH